MSALAVGLAALVAGCASTPPRETAGAPRPAPVPRARRLPPPPERAPSSPRVRLATRMLAVRPPYRYVVRRGDTLWGLAVRFLHDPWLWPDLWYENPAIRNPDLIYPGEVITLETGPSGRPVMIVRTRRGTLVATTSARLAAASLRGVVLRPRVEVRPLRRPLEEIPYRVLAPFLSHPVVLGRRHARRLPYVLRGISERPYMGAGDRAFVRGRLLPNVRRYSVVRIVRPLYTYRSGRRIGLEIVDLGQVRVLRYGNPAIVRITRSYSGIRAGDRLVPLSEQGVRGHLEIRPPARAVRGHIVAVYGNPPDIGTYAIVVIDRGTAAGLRAGDVLSVYSPARRVDEHDGGGLLGGGVRLPELKIGEALIFHAAGRMSLALVTLARRSLRVGDPVRGGRPPRGRGRG